MDILTIINSAVGSISSAVTGILGTVGGTTQLELQRDAARLAANSQSRAAALSSQSKGTAFTVIMLVITALIIAAIIFKPKK